MANVIEFATLFQTALDQQMEQQATSGWMEANAGRVIYNGGKEIKIPKLTMDGLANYDRDNGFTAGSVHLDYETVEMTMDRGRSFQLDENTVNESNFVANAGTVMSEFQRLHVIPEVDAYRYSKIAALAIAAGRASGGYIPAVADIYSKLKADIAAVQDVVGDLPLIIVMNRMVKNVLENSTEITKQLPVVDFTQGNLTTKVNAIDDCVIRPVPSARLKTAYVFNDGKTTGQEGGGFTPDASAKTINWIISAQNAPIAVSKTDAIRIFDPNTNQKARAWGMDYRKYHDLWIPENKLAAVFVNVQEALTTGG
jgi:hypothetical protein